jgi:hypothetical protein
LLSEARSESKSIKTLADFTLLLRAHTLLRLPTLLEAPLLRAFAFLGALLPIQDEFTA